MPAASEAFEWRLKNDRDELAAACAAARSFMDERGFDGRAQYALDLALEELVGNVIRHGCEPGRVHRIDIRVEPGPEGARVWIRDDGRPFDPEAAEDPPAYESLAEAEVGGRGIQMARRMVRAFRYRRAGGENQLEFEVPRSAGREP